MRLETPVSFATLSMVGASFSRPLEMTAHSGVSVQSQVASPFTQEGSEGGSAVAVVPVIDSLRAAMAPLTLKIPKRMPKNTKVNARPMKAKA